MGTEVTSITCNHCGAPLAIQTDTRFLTCAHCGSRLEVHRTGGALYTEVLQSIDDRTQRIEQDVEAIRRQNEIEQLDREWQIRRGRYMVQGKDGQTSEPSIVGALFTGVVGVGGGIFFAVITSGHGAPAFFPLFGVLFALAGLAMAVTILMKAANYRDAEQRYQRDRERLLNADRTVPQNI